MKLNNLFENLNKKPIYKYLLLGLAVIFLLIQFFVQLDLAKKDSQTTDESSHINAGYSYITSDQFRFNPEHPPLTKELTGLAILHLHLKTSPQMQVLFNQSSNFFYDSWQQNLSSGNILLYQAGNNTNQLLFWGRVPFVLITLILGIV